MKKTIILIIGLVIIAIIIVVIALTSNNSKPSSGSLVTTPTPIEVPGQQSNPLSLSISSTNPDDNQKNIAVNQSISITFNRLFSPDELSITSWPLFSYTTQIQGKKLIITPKQNLQVNTTYTYSINYVNPISSETRSFATIGNNPTAPSTYVRTGSPADPYHGVETPDLYLSNHTPYTGTTFSVKNDFTSTPSDHFFFTVTLTGPDQNQDKQDFTNWLHSLGFSDANIQSLDIRYQ